MCFHFFLFSKQEVDQYQEIVADEFSGYESIFKKRTGTKKDGLVIAFKRNKFSLIEKTEIEFNDCPTKKKDRVALIGNFTSVISNFIKNIKHFAVDLQSTKTKKVITVVNTHLDYKNEDVRNKQLIYLLEKLKLKGHPSEKKPLIITGDFNDVPKSRVFDMIVHFSVQSKNKKSEKPKKSKKEESANNNLQFVMKSSYPSFTPFNEEICTSFFLENKQIDYIFFNHSCLEVISILEPVMIYHSLPDENNPSDHVPISCFLQFKT